MGSHGGVDARVKRRLQLVYPTAKTPPFPCYTTLALALSSTDLHEGKSLSDSLATEICLLQSYFWILYDPVDIDQIDG